MNIGDQVCQPPASISFCPSTIRRPAAMSRAQVRSAVVSVNTPGVLVSNTRRAFRLGRSALS